MRAYNPAAMHSSGHGFRTDQSQSSRERQCWCRSTRDKSSLCAGHFHRQFPSHHRSHPSSCHPRPQARRVWQDFPRAPDKDTRSQKQARCPGQRGYRRTFLFRRTGRCCWDFRRTGGDLRRPASGLCSQVRAVQHTRQGIARKGPDLFSLHFKSRSRESAQDSDL